jgi:hypothetical protein
MLPSNIVGTHTSLLGPYVYLYNSIRMVLIEAVAVEPPLLHLRK